MGKTATEAGRARRAPGSAAALVALAAAWGAVAVLVVVAGARDAARPGDHAPNVFGLLLALVGALLLASVAAGLIGLAAAVARGSRTGRALAIATVGAASVVNGALLALGSSSLRNALMPWGGLHLVALLAAFALLVLRR